MTSGFLSRSRRAGNGRMQLGLLALVFAGLLAPAARAEKAARPNIVLIMADDLGWGDVGCYGARAIATPNIDRLAAQGRRFTHGYAPASTCTPSRYALMTGEYAWRQQAKQTSILDGDAPLAIAPGRLTLPQLLRQAGYKTALVGKWHLGVGDGEKPVDFNGEIKPGPLEVGYDSAFFIPATVDRVPTVFIENHRVAGLDPADPIRVSYQKRINAEPTGAERPDLLKQPADAQHAGVIVNGISRIGSMTGGQAAHWHDEDLADVIARRSARFIEEHKDVPFFLSLGTFDPHVPRTPHARFVGATKLGPRGDVIAELDWTVGEVLAALDRAGVADNTLVLFTSDNGPVLFDGYFDRAAELNGDHQPAGGLRGWKYLPYEGGTRVPFIARWPGHVRTGVDDRMICLTDLLATCAALTGQQLPADAGADSLNQLAVLTGQPGDAVRTELVEQGISNTLALRAGDWKFIPRSPGQEASGMGSGANPADQRWGDSIVREDALYDLANDPAEKSNLAAKYPDKVKALRTRLEEIKRPRDAALGVKDQLVFSDDFERDGLCAALKSPIPAFTVADGLLKGHQERADHGGTMTTVLELPQGNAIVEMKFRFAGARSFSLCCDDVKYQGAHAGHISRITVQTNRVTLYDDKEGAMRNDIFELRKSADPQKKAESNRLAEKATRIIPVNLEQNRWYRLALELVGDRMQLSIDGQPVGHLQSPGLAHPTKPNLRFSAWGSTPSQEMHFDELRVWSVKPAAGKEKSL